MTSVSNSASRLQLLHLYRVLIKKAKIFPSKNKVGLLKEIREEFRRNKSLTDQAKIDKCVSIAVKGVGQLAMYSDLKPSSSHWVVNLDQNPMPKSEKTKEK
jgi:hypothetical protein